MKSRGTTPRAQRPPPPVLTNRGHRKNPHISQQCVITDQNDRYSVRKCRDRSRTKKKKNQIRILVQKRSYDWTEWYELEISVNDSVNVQQHEPTRQSTVSSLPTPHQDIEDFQSAVSIHHQPFGLVINHWPRRGRVHTRTYFGSAPEQRIHCCGTRAVFSPAIRAIIPGTKPMAYPARASVRDGR